MEEDAYRKTYNSLTSIPCVFEKALTNKKAKCSLARHFCLADREGYSCAEEKMSIKCRELLGLLRKKSLFVLKLRDVDSPLPHNMEIRVQAGGINGLSRTLADSHVDNMAAEHSSVDNISDLVQQAEIRYGSLQSLPYSEIIQSVEQFQGRRRQR